ncbi:winged helix-turn-helix transcriptional regulator [Lewinella sp. IMCC34183]|uniref:winged helix-turn-helix transcriptional regulator n=1 Tax=Lewinella sp. IMCC34183 TaxID=2248762 RepID=UPI0018E51226|nr:helix-turn-helix domain-containing protein [Lewinella sp. IMCC34183]
MRHRAVRDTLDVIGGKWKIIILTVLRERNMQFNALCREIGISPRIPTRELRDLEINQRVSRTEQDTRPVTLVYAATPPRRHPGAPHCRAGRLGLPTLRGPERQPSRK